MAGASKAQESLNPDLPVCQEEAADDFAPIRN